MWIIRIHQGEPLGHEIEDLLHEHLAGISGLALATVVAGEDRVLHWGVSLCYQRRCIPTHRPCR